MNLDFYKGKKVLVTGHTGFKGSWLSKILVLAGAEVTGYSLEPPTNPNLFDMAGLDGKINSVIGDIRDFDKLKKVFDDFKPEIVFHLAAQPIVITSYEQPKYTYETNVMGTVNIMECVRLSDSVKSVLNVTTDKVYKNNEWCWGYRECEPLDGYDPYSNSKSCSELVTHSYKASFFDKTDIAVSTARAGNVIGGGDFADNRIIPDCVRASIAKKPIIVRNPNSTRPYQHVLEPLNAYLMIAEAQYNDKSLQGYYNVGIALQQVSLRRFSATHGARVRPLNAFQRTALTRLTSLSLIARFLKQLSAGRRYGAQGKPLKKQSNGQKSTLTAAMFQPQLKNKSKNFSESESDKHIIYYF